MQGSCQSREKKEKRAVETICGKNLKRLRSHACWTQWAIQWTKRHECEWAILMWTFFVIIFVESYARWRCKVRNDEGLKHNFLCLMTYASWFFSFRTERVCAMASCKSSVMVYVTIASAVACGAMYDKAALLKTSLVLNCVFTCTFNFVGSSNFRVERSRFLFLCTYQWVRK